VTIFCLVTIHWYFGIKRIQRDKRHRAEVLIPDGAGFALPHEES
jgi:hypothetical protein